MKIELELPEIVIELVDENAAADYMNRNRWIELAIINVLLRKAIEQIERRIECQKIQ